MSGNAKDLELFYRLVWPHRESVLRTARLLTRDMEVADDLAQETMIKAYRAIGQFAEGTNARAWLLSILRNARVDWIRSESRRNNDVSLTLLLEQEHEPEVANVSEITNGSISDDQDILERLADSDLIDALQSLPEEIRWTMLLVEVEGIDHSKASEILSVPVGTIKSRASRGRIMLRSLLKPLAQSRGWTRLPQKESGLNVSQTDMGGLI